MPKESQLKANQAQDIKRAASARLPSARISDDEAALIEDVKVLSGLGGKDMILKAVALLKAELEK